MDNNTKNVLYVGGGVALAYFLVLKPLLVSLGLKKSDVEEQTDKQATAARTKFISDTINKPDPKQTNKGRATKVEGNFALLADQVYQALSKSAVSNDLPKAYNILARLLNDADAALLLKYFGVRQGYQFGLPIGEPSNLSAFVSRAFSQSDIDSLNNLYARSKMKFRF